MVKKTLSRMISVSVAFIVFGIIDNGIMVIAGSTIDHYLGTILSISTMASAGLGNTFSDVIGIIMGRYTEKNIHRILPHNGEVLSTTKTIIAEAIGIFIGCLIGMSPLLFM